MTKSFIVRFAIVLALAVTPAGANRIANQAHGVASATSISASTDTRNSVPEPVALTLLGSGLLGASFWVRRRT